MLSRDLRVALERTVRKARTAAEEGARKALESLAVGHREPYASMTPEQRTLRVRLRAHGRHLGDRRDPGTGKQTINRIARECAYSHWHRMLFARFLAESDFLIEPGTGMAITLADAKEFARERGCDWLVLASTWAGQMLPEIFRANDPVLEIALPPETRAELEMLLEELPLETFLADDSLGWVYQFWQADRKDEVNHSRVKIGADELPPVTQFFTEEYMVQFLLHNTLGAWWAGRVLSACPHIAVSAKDEDELRTACRVGNEKWKYLRFVRQERNNSASGPWRPAAGLFADWPRAAKEITLIDPCMGSGHFLVFALPIFVALRMKEEGLSREDAVDAVLRDNLFGLEIDPRCTQIAAFNLAFTAWRMAGFRSLPALNLACSGVAAGAEKAEWLRLAKEVVAVSEPDAVRDLFGIEETLLTAGVEAQVENGLAVLHDLFAKAPVLGSLIDPRRTVGNILTASFEQLEPLLGQIHDATENNETAEMAVTALGMTKSAELLGRRFTLVVTNVPYLGREKQNLYMRSYFDQHYPEAKHDLACVMVDRFRSLASGVGAIATVSPHNWRFLRKYKKFRELILQNVTIRGLAKLGPGAFETISGQVVSVMLSILQNFYCKDERFFSIDSVEMKMIDKINACSSGSLDWFSQISQIKNVDCIIGYDSGGKPETLEDYGYCFQGLATSDNSQFIVNFWEIPRFESGWEPYQMAPSGVNLLGGCSWGIHWQDGVGRYADHVKELRKAGRLGGWKSGNKAWGKPGVAVNRMGNLPCSLYFGTMFDCNVAVIIPNSSSDLHWIWSQVRSKNYAKDVRRLNSKPSVTNRTLIKVPVDLKEKNKRSSDRTQNIFCQDPAQWLFDGHPARANAPLQVAVARLLGYQWPRQTGSSFMDFPAVGSDGLERHADKNGIVCLAAVASEASARERLVALLAAAFGMNWSVARLAELLAASGFADRSLEDWLRDGFFAEHFKLFHHRPFVWHIWDGHRDGFHALVNYHRLVAPGGEGRRVLEKLIYSFLGAWIDRQRAAVESGSVGAEVRLAHAKHLQNELIKIYDGDPPYDIFVRWKPLRNQPVGWDPDINDGVRINIRPFMHARPLGAKAKGACILRRMPNVKWGKDLGQETPREKEAYPWFWNRDPKDPAQEVDFHGGSDSTFDGARWNDMHYTRACKEAARAQASGRDDL